MSLETTYSPLNGLEIKEILKRVKQLLTERIDKIPYLKEGNAYKQAELHYFFEMTCYPADCPVPTAEWNTLIGLKEGEDAEFDTDKKKIELLVQKRAAILKNAEKIDEFLRKHAPTVTIENTIADKGVPDEVRIQNGLKVPMVQTSKSGAKTEVLVNPSGLKA